MVLKSPEAEFLDKQFFTSGIGVSVKYTAVPFTMSVYWPEQYPEPMTLFLPGTTNGTAPQELQYLGRLGSQTKQNPPYIQSDLFAESRIKKG